MFFFVTLYLHSVLGFSPTRAGAAYVPVAQLVTVSAIIGSALITRLGSRPLIVAGALINASFQVGAALGLAVLTAVATSRTRSLLAAHAPGAVALSSGFHRALLVAGVFLVAAAVIGLRAANTRGEPTGEVTELAAGADSAVATSHPETEVTQ